MNRLRTLLRSLAWWVLATVRPQDDEIDAAIRASFVDVGLDPATYIVDLDLGSKKYEVLHHAGRRLGYRFETVAQIKELLQ